MFSQAQINNILNQQNGWRDHTASGTLRGFNNAILPGATRMARAQWSNQLAEFAVLNTLQCQMRHDQCRSTSQFNFAGQNLAMRQTSAATIDVNESIRLSIDMWGSQHVHVRVSDINSLTGTFISLQLLILKFNFKYN